MFLVPESLTFVTLMRTAVLVSLYAHPLRVFTTFIFCLFLQVSWDDVKCTYGHSDLYW